MLYYEDLRREVRSMLAYHLKRNRKFRILVKGQPYDSYKWIDVHRELAVTHMLLTMSGYISSSLSEELNRVYRRYYDRYLNWDK